MLTVFYAVQGNHLLWKFPVQLQAIPGQAYPSSPGGFPDAGYQQRYDLEPLACFPKNRICPRFGGQALQHFKRDIQMALLDDSIQINPMLKVKRPTPRKDEKMQDELGGTS